MPSLALLACLASATSSTFFERDATFADAPRLGARGAAPQMDEAHSRTSVYQTHSGEPRSTTSTRWPTPRSTHVIDRSSSVTKELAAHLPPRGTSEPQDCRASSVRSTTTTAGVRAARDLLITPPSALTKLDIDQTGQVSAMEETSRAPSPELEDDQNIWSTLDAAAPRAPARAMYVHFRAMRWPQPQPVNSLTVSRWASCIIGGVSSSG